ncbi:SMP-30/gluconolactonase/LRE family protein, partial [Candidatus Neomarinimicrobiota bacterium]
MRGITIVGNTIWGACTANDPPDWSQVLVGFDINTGVVTNTITITGGVFINDVTADPNGIIYLSDNMNIYRVDPAAGTFTIFYANAWANGLLYEADKDRLLYVDNSPIVGSQISAINMTTSGMTPLYINPVDVFSLDGLTVDHLGNYYVSAWSWPHRVFRYDPNISSIKVASTGHNGVAHDGAADIFFHMPGTGKAQGGNETQNNGGTLVV